MTSAVMLERGSFGTAPAPAAANAPGAAPQTGNWCVVPRCEIRAERCEGGFKLSCCCSDDIACATLQNLCRMLAGGQCSVCCQLNGITVCECKLTCGHCKCEATEDGCCITCTSGDAGCCEILQCCCDAIACCARNGCCCYVCFNGTPVCCGC